MSTKISYDQILLALLPNVLPLNENEQDPYFSKMVSSRLRVCADTAEDIYWYLKFKDIAQNYRLCFTLKNLQGTYENLQAFRFRFEQRCEAWFDVNYMFSNHTFDSVEYNLNDTGFWAEAFMEYVSVKYGHEGLVFRQAKNAGGDVVVQVSRPFGSRV